MEQPTSRVAGARVGIDGRYLSKPGMGINVYTVGVIDILLSLGAEVVVLTNVDPVGDLDPQITVRRFGSARNLVWDQVDLPRHFAHHEYDVYWAPANNGIPLRGPRPPRTIITLHDLIPLLQPMGHILKRPLYGLPWVASVAAGALAADTITTVSEFSAARIRRWLGRRAVVLPPPAVRDAPAAAPTPPAHPDLRRRYVLYNGGFGSRKRLDTLVHAMALLPRHEDLQLVCLGRHMDHYRDLITGLGLTDRVVTPGYVSEADRDAWVQHAFALAYPSTMEGFGLPLLEAMSRGVPVVTSPNSSLHEVGGSAALFADPARATEWAAALTRLLEPQVREQCRERGFAQAQRYRATDLEALVAELIAPADRPRSSKRTRGGRR